MAVKLRQKNGDGKWWLVIHHRGSRTTRCLGRIDRRQAERIRKEVETGIALKDLGLHRSQVPIVSEHAAEWLRLVGSRCKPGTYVRYAGIIRAYVIPHIGTLRLDQVTVAHCKRMCMEWPGHMAYASCKTAHAVANALFNEAVHDRHIAENPLPPFSRLFGSRPATPITDKIWVIPAHELASILDTADATLPRIYGALFLFLSRTGCRLGEALGLDWDAVNLMAQTAEIRATYSAHYGLGSPKSGRARTVALSPALVHRLADLKQSLEKDAWQQGKPMPDAVFITTRTRNRIAPDLVRKQWKACLRKLGLPGYRPHDLRHTFASQLLANGESVKTVQMALGHHSAKITLDVYGHLMPDRPYPNVAALDASPGRTRHDKQQAGS